MSEGRISGNIFFEMKLLTSFFNYKSTVDEVQKGDCLGI